MRLRRAGFVLAGGRSSRMGLDKALIQWRGTTLAAHVAAEVARAAHNAAIVGNPQRYAALGYPVIPDLRPPHSGPLAGIEAALASSPAELSLVVACDMPFVSADFLQTLFDLPEEAGCLVPLDRSGRPQPLCAVYRRECLAAVSAALDAGHPRAVDVLGNLSPAFLAVADDACLANWNTREDVVQEQLREQDR